MDGDKFATARAAGGAAGLTLYGVTLNEWVAIFTIAYFAVQIIILTPALSKTLKGWHKGFKKWRAR